MSGIIHYGTYEIKTDPTYVENIEHSIYPPRVRYKEIYCFSMNNSSPLNCAVQKSNGQWMPEHWVRAKPFKPREEDPTGENGD